MPLYVMNGKSPALAPHANTWVAPSADLIGDVQLGEESSAWFNAVIRADNTPIVIGRGSNVQDGAVLHSDPGSPLSIGDEVTIGHRAVLHGCTIGDRVLIGMGATILNGAVIGEGSIVGAGALVTEGKTFPAGSLIVGIPAQARRSLGDAEHAMIKEVAEDYRLKAIRYAAELVPA